MVTFGEELMKYFARQDRRDGKKGVKNHAAKVTKVPKTKRRKYGVNETVDYKLVHWTQQCLLPICYSNSKLPKVQSSLKI